MVEGACRHVHRLVRSTCFGRARINRVPLLVNIPINNTSPPCRPFRRSLSFPRYSHSFRCTRIHRLAAVREQKRWQIYDERNRRSRRIQPTTVDERENVPFLYANTRTAYLGSGQRHTNYRQIRIGARLERTLREGNVASRVTRLLIFLCHLRPCNESIWNRTLAVSHPPLKRFVFVAKSTSLWITLDRTVRCSSGEMPGIFATNSGIVFPTIFFLTLSN